MLVLSMVVVLVQVRVRGLVAVLVQLEEGVWHLCLVSWLALLEVARLVFLIRLVQLGIHLVYPTRLLCLAETVAKQYWRRHWNQTL